MALCLYPLPALHMVGKCKNDIKNTSKKVIKNLCKYNTYYTIIIHTDLGMGYLDLIGLSLEAWTTNEYKLKTGENAMSSQLN